MVMVGEGGLVASSVLEEGSWAVVGAAIGRRASSPSTSMTIKWKERGTYTVDVDDAGQAIATRRPENRPLPYSTTMCRRTSLADDYSILARLILIDPTTMLRASRALICPDPLVISL